MNRTWHLQYPCHFATSSTSPTSSALSARRPTNHVPDSWYSMKNAKPEWRNVFAKPSEHLSVFHCRKRHGRSGCAAVLVVKAVRRSKAE